MNYFNVKNYFSSNFGFRVLALFTLVTISTLFVFEAYVVIVNHLEGDLPIPPNFGNHPQVINMLTDQARKDTFRFALIGDTKSEGTFERIAEALRREELDFAVLLGDVSYKGKESFHRLLQSAGLYSDG